ncbi:MAG TPA: hypothetical protein VEC16_02155 [Alphaproteobacteria bacterium]|nr:hypothetical protein [Alphaproteobacteria bacterium]
MSKKGSMELSVNSIVILVIAIVMLGLILGFVRSKFSGLDKQLVQDEPEAQPASPSEPLTISRENILVSPGEDVTLKLQAYAKTAIAATTVPTITCADLTFGTGALKATGKAISEGNSDKYLATLKIPSSAAKGKHLCTISLSGSGSKDVIIEVR